LIHHNPWYIAVGADTCVFAGSGKSGCLFGILEVRSGVRSFWWLVTYEAPEQQQVANTSNIVEYAGYIIRPTNSF